MSRIIADNILRSFLSINSMLRDELALVRRELARRSWERKYNPNWPNQPRAPSGVPEGGQWVSGGAVSQPARVQSESITRPSSSPAPQEAGRLRTPQPRHSDGHIRVPLSVFARVHPLAIATLLTGDTPRPQVSARSVPGTNDLVLMVVEYENQRFAGFKRVLRAERRTPIVVFGIDTGLTTNEPAELQSLDVDVVVEGEHVVFDPQALAREYGREIAGVTDASRDDPPGLPQGEVIATENDEEAELVARMRAAGQSTAQIQTALEILRSNSGTSSSEAYRRNPGVAFNSRPLREESQDWLRGTHGNAGRIPEQVAARLRGRVFNNFRAFERELWRTVGDTLELSSQFSQGDQDRMQNGLPPLAPPEQRHGTQVSYILHHDVRVADNPARQYDMSNIVVVTPRLHLDIMGRRAHFGRRRTSESKCIMTREQMIKLLSRYKTLKGSRERLDRMLYDLSLAAPHADIIELISVHWDLSPEEIVDEALRREEVWKGRAYRPS